MADLVSQVYAVITIGPVLFCLVIAWLFIDRRRPRVGILSGLGIIFVLLLAAEWWVYSDCQQCQSTAGYPASTLCCEWTVPGMLIYAGVAFIDAVVFLLISLGIAWVYKRFVFKAGGSAQ
jgi:hypothetical protein